MLVNAKRLCADLEQLATFGGRENGGVNRPAYSPADVEARQWYAARAREAGLSAHQDAALNVLIGPYQEPGAVWTGSHIDSVPNGGRFDGALGSIAALECVRRLHEENITLKRPVCAVGFADEEGTFHGFLGSKSLMDGLEGVDMSVLHDRNGTTLIDAVTAAGGDVQGMQSANRLVHAPHCFLELHIEQGPRLEATRTQIGIVTSIVGVANATLTFTGRADHAGTTPMHMRRDALRGACAFLHAAPDIPQQLQQADAVITCGQLEVAPGASNVVPQTVTLQLDFRDTTRSGMERLQQRLQALAQQCADDFELELNFTLDSITEPVATDDALSSLLESKARDLDLSVCRMPSGASHDSQVLATRCPVGMVFVPSVAGRSHSPLEFTPAEDIINGANVLLQSLLELAT